MTAIGNLFCMLAYYWSFALYDVTIETFLKLLHKLNFSLGSAVYILRLFKLEHCLPLRLQRSYLLYKTENNTYFRPWIYYDINK